MKGKGINYVKRLKDMLERQAINTFTKDMRICYRKHGFSSNQLMGSMLILMVAGLEEAGIELSRGKINPAWLEIMNDARKKFDALIQALVEKALNEGIARRGK